MSKVVLHFSLARPLNETELKRIADAHSVYGITRIQVAPALDRLTVEYDASRLTPPQVEDVLHQRGIPATRIQT